MARSLVNFAGFQAGWFACVLSAAAGQPWIGIAVVAALVALHLLLQRNRHWEVWLLAFAAMFGYTMDSFAVLVGAIEFPVQTRLGWPSTLWMVAMWVNLAMTLNVSLRWLRDRYAAAAIFGLVGGPLSYAVGAQFGAIALGWDTLPGLIAIGVEWLISMPALAWVARLTHGADLTGKRRDGEDLLAAEGPS